MQLPNEWLWDMVDEFMYQFQAYHQFRGKISQHTPEDKQALLEFEASKEKVHIRGCELFYLNWML